MIEKKKRENNGLWRLIRSFKFNRLAHIQKGNDAHSGAHRIICLIWEININSQNFDYCIRKIVHLKKAFNWLSLASMIHPIIQLLLLRLENCFRKSEQLQFCDLMCYVDRGRLNVPKSKYKITKPDTIDWYRNIAQNILWILNYDFGISIITAEDGLKPHNCITFRLFAHFCCGILGYHFRHPSVVQNQIEQPPNDAYEIIIA